MIKTSRQPISHPPVSAITNDPFWQDNIQRLGPPWQHLILTWQKNTFLVLKCFEWFWVMPEKKGWIFTYISINVVDLQSTTDIKVQSQLGKIVVDDISEIGDPSGATVDFEVTGHWYFASLSTAYDRDGLTMSYIFIPHRIHVWYIC